MTDGGQRALDVLSLMVLEDGKRWGETAAHFQWENARAILDIDRRGPAALDRAAAWREEDDGPGGYPAGGPVRAGPADGPAVRRRVGRGAGPGADRRGARPDRADAGAGGRSSARASWRSLHAATARVVRALAADVSAMGKRAWMIVLDEVANWPETRKARRFWGVLTSR